MDSGLALRAPRNDEREYVHWTAKRPGSLPAFRFLRRPHPEEPGAAGRLEGWCGARRLMFRDGAVRLLTM